MARTTPLRIALGISAVAVTAATAIIALPSAGSAQSAPTEQRSVVRAETVAPGLSAAFGVLRRSVSAGDALPATFLAREAANPTDVLQGLAGANPSLARRAQGLPSGSAWIVPGNGMICIATALPGTVQVGATSCTVSDAAAAGRLALSARSSQQGWQWVVGLTPDNVAQVSVIRADGTTQTVDVHDNVYASMFTGPPATSVRFTDGSGASTAFDL